MRFLSLICSAAVAVLFVSAPRVFAQEAAPPPAHISFVQGPVSIVSVDHPDEPEPAVVNMPLVEGDRIITGANARAEVMFPDGSAIEIDPSSDVELLSATRVRVIAGAIEHRAAAPADPRSASTQYLPPDLQPYGADLDQNGAWQYDPQYGNVWYPTTIAADWRPYYDGYWYSAPRYGWTWVGDARWTWPTHHYGRWGYARNRWFWIPGRSYAAAWVSWGTAADYVSWCPLGYDGRPVVALSVWSSGSGVGRFRRGSGFNAWTIVRRDHFGSRAYSPRRYGVDPYRLAANTTFIEHRTPPSRDRRGSFSSGAGNARQSSAIGRQSPGAGRPSSVDGRQPAYRGNRESVGRSPGSVGVAVPRYGNRDADGGRRDPRNDRRSTGNGERATSNERQATTPVPPTPTLPPSTANDHPAYRPRYVPRDQPQAQQPPPAPAYRDRRTNGGDARATPQRSERPAPAQGRPAPAQNRPAPRASAPSAPPPSTAAPARREGGNPPARERSRDGQTTGTATRRPR